MIRRALVALAILSLLAPSYPVLIWTVIAVVAPFQSLLQKIMLLLACAAYWWGVMIAWEISKHFFLRAEQPYRCSKAWAGLAILIGGILALELLMAGNDKGQTARGFMLSALIAPLLLGWLLKASPNIALQRDASPAAQARAPELER